MAIGHSSSPCFVQSSAATARFSSGWPLTAAELNTATTLIRLATGIHCLDHLRFLPHYRAAPHLREVVGVHPTPKHQVGRAGLRMIDPN